MTEYNSLPTQFTDVMCDVESTGRWPDRTAILQIGAVRFNLEHMTIDSSDMFDRCLHMPPHRFWEESTRDFWSRQDPAVFNDIIARAEEPSDVMKLFYDWSTKIPNLRFWAKPSHFDWNFIQSYITDYGYPMPYHYRTARDMNSWIEARYYPNPVPAIELPDLGAAHNALNDCLMQIGTLFQHYDNTKETNDE